MAGDLPQHVQELVQLHGEHDTPITVSVKRSEEINSYNTYLAKCVFKTLLSLQ